MLIFRVTNYFDLYFKFIITDKKGTQYIWYCISICLEGLRKFIINTNAANMKIPVDLRT